MVSYQSGGEVLRPGARVAFSGRITVNNELVPQGEKLRELCSEVGLVYKTAVSQTGCDAVVADSLTTARCGGPRLWKADCIGGGFQRLGAG